MQVCFTRLSIIRLTIWTLMERVVGGQILMEGFSGGEVGGSGG